MYKIVKKKQLSDDMFLMNIYAPRIAKSALPGQFLIIKMSEKSERIPLTISDFDKNNGTITIVFKAIGKSTAEMSKYIEGQSFTDVVGPLGTPSEFVNLPLAELKNKKLVFVGGGVGIAPIYPQVKWLHEHGVCADVIIGAKNKNLLVFEKELAPICNLHITTDDNSCGTKGLVTDKLKELIIEGKKIDEVVSIGPLVMMKFVSQLATEYNIKCVVSMNSLMVDGTGMCGACRVSVGKEMKFACVDGPEFDGALIDFDEAMKRQAMYNTYEGKKIIEDSEIAEGHKCFIGGISDETAKKHRVEARERAVSERITNFKEVCLGYNAEEAIEEAQRCLQCKKPMCVSGCPVQINISEFVKYIAEGNFNKAAASIYRDSALPAVCGRVCPQEIQCEGKCVLSKKSQPIAVGKLERFIGDWARENKLSFDENIKKNKHKVAIIGSGPSGITCAKELAAKGYNITIFEALHEFGGVLVYGIPSFRLPKETVVKHEVENLKKMGVKFENNVVIGRTVSIDSLFKDEGFEAIFIGTGAGLPNFMNIPGENLCGVVSANEFLTRNNLLFAYKEGYETPNFAGKKVAVVGGGNVAIDAARTAIRLGAEVYIVYRRSEDELPARIEELNHAKEEGVIFKTLCAPIEIIGNENGWVKSMKLVKMQLSEPDSSGRPRPVIIPNSEFSLDVDMVIMSIGTSPNPLIKKTTKGLETNKWGCIIANEETGQTSRDGIFAGGDAVSGAATVILAMGAGKKAAKAIDDYLISK